MTRVFEQWPAPVRKALESRPTFVLDEPLVKKLGLDPQKFRGQGLPPGVTYDEAVEVVKGTEWAQGLAKGMCTKMFGATPGTPEYDRCVARVSDRVARGVLK